MNASMPQPVPVPSHARHGSTSSASSLSHFQPPPPPAPLASTSTGSSAVNQTRIILLSQFNPALKSKDLIQLVQERTGPEAAAAFKLKWRDDTSCFVVFADPHTAKRTFLRLVADPPAPLSPRETGTYAPCIHAYTGPDAQQIILAVQNKQRTRSIAGLGAVSGSPTGAGAGQQQGGHHHRRLSSSAASSMIPPTGPPPLPPQQQAASGQSGQHHRTASWTRHSIDRRAAAASISSSSPSRTRTTTTTSTDAGPGSGPGPGSDSWRAASPDVITSQSGPSGVVAGEAPRRFGSGRAETSSPSSGTGDTSTTMAPAGRNA
ncbi:hypothetical protein JCM3774_005080 [Rhodotorula dairenensis]